MQCQHENAQRDLYSASSHSGARWALQARVGHYRLALGSQGFLDTNILESVMRKSHVGSPQHEPFCVLVEYRL